MALTRFSSVWSPEPLATQTKDRSYKVRAHQLCLPLHHGATATASRPPTSIRLLKSTLIFYLTVLCGNLFLPACVLFISPKFSTENYFYQPVYCLFHHSFLQNYFNPIMTQSQQFTQKSTLFYTSRCGSRHLDTHVKLGVGFPAPQFYHGAIGEYRDFLCRATRVLRYCYEPSVGLEYWWPFSRLEC